MAAGIPDEPAERRVDGIPGRGDQAFAPREPDSSLLIFLFADIRGYTAFTQRHGDEAAAVLTAMFATTTRALAETFDGSVLELRGDEALCVFTSPRQSLRCAVALQRRFVELTVDDPAHPMTVGIGLDVGEAVHGPDGYRGGALNLAARLCSQAKAGEILATGELTHLARTIDGVRYQPLDHLTLKGLAEPVQPVRVVPEGADPVQQLAAAVTPVPPHRSPLGRLAAHPRAVVAAASATLLVLGTGAVILATRGDSTAAPSRHENSLELVDVHTGRLLDWVGLHDTPGATAVAGNTIWTASPTANVVSRVDVHDRTVSRISVGTEPVALAIGAGSVWVANNGSGTVTRIDTRTDDPTEIPGVGVGPSGIAYGDGSVWVTDAGDGVVARIDPAQNKVVQRIRVGDSPTGIVVDRDVWVVDTNSHTLERINGTGSLHRVVRTYQVGNGPVGVAVVGGNAWVTNSLDGTVSRVPIDGTAVTDYPLGAEPRHVAVVDKHLWITSHVTGTVYEFDPKSRTTVHRRSVGAVPDGLAGSGSRVWVATTIDPAQHRGGTLKLVGVDPQSIDPVFPFEAGNWLLNSTWDGLVGFQHETGAAGGLVVPDLAVALPSVSSDGRTYTFQLRRGIHWSTGAPVTVQDVQRGIERAVLEFGTTLNTVIAGADRCSVRRCDISGLSIDAAANSVTITLVHANVGFLNLLTAAPAAPSSTPLPHDNTRVIAATGPYRIDRYVPGRELDLVRNTYFHEWSHAAQPAGLPNRIEYRIVSGDARSALRAARMVREGRADWADVRGVPDAGAEFGGRLHITPAETLFGLSLNTTTEPFVHRNARRALAYALDRRSITNAWFTPGTPACQFLPPSWPGYRPYCPYTGAADDTGSWYQNDLNKGLELVRGLDLSVPVMVWATPYTARALRQVVTALRELGYTDVRLHISRLRGLKYFGYVADSRNAVQAAFFGWIGGDASPSDLLSAWSCAAVTKASQDNVNTAQFCDRSIDALMSKARVAQQTSLSAASAVWHHVDRALVDAAPWIPLVDPTYVDAVSARVQGYGRHLWLGPLFDQIRLR